MSSAEHAQLHMYVMDRLVMAAAPDEDPPTSAEGREPSQANKLPHTQTISKSIQQLNTYVHVMRIIRSVAAATHA